MKKSNFLCPKCKGHLNAGGYVIFSTKNKRKQRGLVLLSPKVGSYSVKYHESYGFEKGEAIDFACPICSKSLHAKENSENVSIIMVDENDTEYKVLFSRIFGNQSTYVLSNDDVEVFGDDAVEFDDLLEDSDFL
ncbi:MAG TPA: hypothetical protein EYM84_09430 [Flavobacteriales bacterium]|nr:hypothetical protein [Flavobacteriales bacterium]HIN40480.1 hypothetical protein [Flavobacteriales bacterium]